MPKLTSEQVRGTQFEIWLEQLLKDLGKWRVRRNVVYQRSRRNSRQVDVEYRNLRGLVICETKYHGKSNVGLDIRAKKKSGRKRTIDDLLEEVEERRQFVGARSAILVTNKDFTKQLYEHSTKFKKVQLYTGYDLQRLLKIRRLYLPGRSLESQIHRIDLRKYRTEPVRTHL